MQQTSLAIVEDTPDVLKARLKREWEAIEARKQAGEVDYDVQRAQTITTYLELKLSQTEIGKTVGINQGWLNQLLRYGRFMTFAIATAIAKECAIPEARFRRYWKETVDKTAMAILRGNGRQENRRAKLEYEQQVFQQIAEKVEKDIMPTVASTARKKTVKDIKPAQLASLRKEVQSYQVLKRKEVQEAYRKIEEDVRALIELSGCTRSTYAPHILAMHAKRLKVGFADLQRALKGQVDEWLLDVMD
jgi:hypothetical protein